MICLCVIYKYEFSVIAYTAIFIPVYLILFTDQLTRICKCFLDFQDIFFCTNECGRKYKSKTALYTHLKYECGVDPQFQCDVCQRSFKHKCTFKIHMIREHNVVI